MGQAGGDVEPVREIPAFLCYRRVDGEAAAEAVYSLIHDQVLEITGMLVPIKLFFDKRLGAVSDWTEHHRPALDRARAMLIIITPGMAADQSGPGHEDWVHHELRWWLQHRPTVEPILIDATGQGVRWLPKFVQARWKNVNWLQLDIHALSNLPEKDRQAQETTLRSRILAGIMEREGLIRYQDVERLRRLLRGFRIATVASALLAIVLLIIAAWLQRTVTSEKRARHEATAHRLLAESRQQDALWDAEALRQYDLRVEHANAKEALAKAMPEERPVLELRIANLARELEEIASRLEEHSKQASSSRALASSELQLAALAPRDIQQMLPGIFSIEFSAIGFGESMLLHYGDPGAPRFLLIDGGQANAFTNIVEPRLNALKRRWAKERSLQLEAVVVTNSDNDRLAGIDELLSFVSEVNPRPYDIRALWYNSFGPAFPEWKKSLIRLRAEHLAVRLNAPFDRFVMRPAEGRVSIPFEGGLTATVLNPTANELRKFHHWWRREAERMGHTQIDDFVEETFNAVPIQHEDSGQTVAADANNAASGRDSSISNQASIVLLFEFAGRRFLHGGDANCSQILDGLRAAGLLDSRGGIEVDLFLVPHQGSKNNVSEACFQRIRASRYLFTGNGRYFGSRELPTLELIMRMRKGERYELNFVHRDGTGDFSRALDAHFARFPSQEWGYQRVFRSNRQNNLMINLAERVRY
jgi:beta-lactamase superfamily II metal-dependent hydrolase